MMRRAGFLLAISLAAASSAALAAKYESFELKSGETVEGTVRAEDGDFFTVRGVDESDRIVFKTDIKSRRALSGAPLPVAAPAPKPDAPPKPASSGVTSGWLEGSSGYRDAERLTQETGKNAAIYFFASWCPYCKKFDQNVLNSPEVSKHLFGSIRVRVDVDKEPDLASAYEVRAIPAFFVLTPEKDATPVPAHQNPADFVRALREAKLRQGDS